MPRSSKRRNRSADLDPKDKSLAQLQTLPRQSLILLAAARNLVTTGTKTRIAYRIFAHEHHDAHAARCHPYCITHYCPGCVAATLIAFTLQGVLLPPLLHYTLLSRVCCCHPYYIHFAGCVAATPITVMLQGVLLPPYITRGCTQQP